MQKNLIVVMALSVASCINAMDMTNVENELMSPVAKANVIAKPVLTPQDLEAREQAFIARMEADLAAKAARLNAPAVVPAAAPAAN
jgi:hypothetical protein